MDARLTGGTRSVPGRQPRALAWIDAHPLAFVAVVAAIPRLVVMAGILVLVDGPVFNDVTYYTDWARQVAAGDYAYFGEGTHWDAVGNAAFVYPIAFLYEIFGPRPLIGALLSVGYGVATAVVVSRLALEVLPRRWAIVPGLIVALLPSLVLWSSIPLKDSATWLALALAALLVALGARSEGRALALSGAALGALIVVLSFLREHTMVVAVCGLVLASWVGPKRARIQRVAGAAILAVGVPWLLGWGPLGIDVVTGAGSLAERRSLNARDAVTAFVAPGPGDSLGQPESAPGAEAPATVPERPFLDPDWETLRDTSSGVVADLAHLPRGVSVMLVEPLPWRPAANSRVLFAKLETIVWYPLLALAVVGMGTVWRRRRVLLYPTLVGGGTLVMYALSEGNFGTAYRHRAEFIWVVALLATFSIYQIRERYRARRTS